MRPIDYAIKMIVAFNMSIDLFNNLVENLYYNDNDFMHATLNCLEESDNEVYNKALDAFHQLDGCQL